MKAVYGLTIASELVKLHPRTIINYEKKGLIKPERSLTNRRLFSDDDLKKLLFIKYLRKDKKLNIPAIELIFKENLSSLFPEFNSSQQLKTILEEG